METIVVQLHHGPDGGVEVQASHDRDSWTHHVDAAALNRARQAAAALAAGFESGHRPLADPVALVQLGALLRDTFLAPLYAPSTDALAQGEGRLLFVSPAADCLNLPWELLPGAAGRFLVADGRWAIRRATRTPLPPPSAPPAARPLRLLFTACAPQGDGVRPLDFEKEEEAILRLADKLGGQVHLDIAEAGTFDELRDLISELKPHVVHLSGHGALRDGLGTFAFEDDRGRLDERAGPAMAEQLFAGRGVRLVFVSGCQSAQAGVAGLCQSLTAAGHVPLALGWGASIADDRATDFARVLFHELAAGQPVDHAVCAARRHLLEQGRVRRAGAELLDASFALPQLFAAEAVDALLDEYRPPERPKRPGVRYELLGDSIRGLREGFVGRRRLLQRTRPALRAGEKTVVLLTGIGGAGKSTLATRLANRCTQDGWCLAAVQARRNEAPFFCQRLLGEIATACQRLGREADEKTLRDGQRPLAHRLRLAVKVLNEARILLVLDNLEDLMPPPPAPPRWLDPDFAGFFRELATRLTGAGRALLTCRYVPEGFDPNQPNLAHESLPDFTEADFFKYLRRHDRVATRIDRGELPRDLLSAFHRKLGATPRFIEQASAVLAAIDPDRLREQLERVGEPTAGTDPDELHRLQQAYFHDLFLPQLYEALPPELRNAIGRLALVEIPLPLDGVARVAGLGENEAANGTDRWLRLGLLQRFGEPDEAPLFAVYPLQRDFLTAPERVAAAQAREAHSAAAAFFQECFQKDREQELRLAIGAELRACLYHATEAGDRERRRWAVVELCWRMIQRADFAPARELAEPLLTEVRHPDLLQVIARVASDTGDWKQARTLSEEEQAARQALGDRAGEAATWHSLATIDLREGNYAAAREKFGKALAMRQAIGDRAGEAATWHQLATIDLREGNYAAARENLGKALAMRQAIGDRAGEAATWHQLATIDLNEGNYAAAKQKYGKAQTTLQAIGDRAGEAATFYQIGFVAWQTGRLQTGIRLVSLCFAIESAIGAGGVKETLLQGLMPMAQKLGLKEVGLKAVIEEATAAYQRDRGAALVREAFAELQEPV